MRYSCTEFAATAYFLDGGMLRYPRVDINMRMIIIIETKEVRLLGNTNERRCSWGRSTWERPGTARKYGNSYRQPHQRTGSVPPAPSGRSTVEHRPAHPLHRLSQSQCHAKLSQPGAVPGHPRPGLPAIGKLSSYGSATAARARGRPHGMPIARLKLRN